MNIMLDSGAYSAYRRGVVINIDQYIEFIKKNEAHIGTAVNLDVIGDGKGSYENWLYMRKQGIDVMPVYHIGTATKWLKKYLKKTEYIGLGAVAKLSTSQRNLGLTRVWREFLINKKTKKPAVKVHGMGLTALNLIKRYPWFSVDSITPVLEAGFGGIFVPKIRGGRRDYLDLDLYKISDQYKHQAGSDRSFMNIKPRMQQIYKELFEEKGFELGQITGINPRLKNKKNDPRYIERALLFPEEGADTNRDINPTLANEGAQRKKWNLLVWAEMRKALPTWDRSFNPEADIHALKKSDDSTIIYTGGSMDVLKDIVGLDIDLGFLFSYVIITKNFIPRMNELLNNKDE